MNLNEFDDLVKQVFGGVLFEHGFTVEHSKGCTFHRKVSCDIYHFIQPIRGRSGTWYYIAVYPHSPSIFPLFKDKFPDNLGWPTDSYSCLSEQEVGLTQQQFNCKSEDNFRRGFENRVNPALLNVGIPYLEQFKTVDDIIPAIRHPSFLAFALHHVGRAAEARQALQSERERLRRLDTSNEDVAMLLAHTERLLSSST